MQRLIEDGVERRKGDVESAVVRKLDEELSKCKAVIDTLSRCAPNVLFVGVKGLVHGSSGRAQHLLLPFLSFYFGSQSPCSLFHVLLYWLPICRHSGSPLAHKWMTEMTAAAAVPEAVLIRHCNRKAMPALRSRVLQGQL